MSALVAHVERPIMQRNSPRRVLLTIAAFTFVLTGFHAGGQAHGALCWMPPVEGPVSDAFRSPDCRWCPGNRGIEYATSSGLAVVAVATGRVTFAGTVAGTGYLVVRHGDGRRVTYGNVVVGAHDAGDLVVRGARVATTAGRLHFGVRQGDRYVDPAPFIGRLVYSPRMIPSNGGQGPLSPPPRLRCGG